MPPKKQKRIRLHLDKVERRKLQEIKANKPEYADLELYQVAHMELRLRLFEEYRKLAEAAEKTGKQLRNARLVYPEISEILVGIYETAENIGVFQE
jgi:hypothetical protein